MKGGLKSAPTTHTANVTPTHYKIDVAFEPERHFLRATAEVTLRVAEKTEAIEFELNRHLTLQSVTDQQGRALEFIRSRRLNSHKLLVRLAEPVDPRRGGPACPPNPAGQPGQTHRSAPTGSTEGLSPESGTSSDRLTLTFTYEGALPPGPLDYITKDGILLRDESRWYPSPDFSAFTQCDVTIRLPPKWWGITSGKFAGMETNVWMRYQTGYPVSGRAILAYPPVLNCQPKEGNRLWTHPGEGYKPSIDLCRGWGQPDSAFFEIRAGANQIITSLGKTYGEYTEDGFSITEGFRGQHGVIGYSAPVFLVVSEDVVKWHGYPGFAPEFLPHEIAHQWFPIEVTLRSEDDGWLAESLAEYLAWRYLEEKQPQDARRMVARAMRNALAYQPLRPLRLGLKLFALEDWDVTHATLYQRGMLVWRTLETVIDRKRVDAALREYYRRHRGGPASIADFRGICEEISERDLGWFFNYYINGTELPEITLRRLPAAAPGELAGEIVIRNAPPEFQVRVGMRIVTTGGAFEHSVAARGEVTPFAIEVRDPVTSVMLDPDLRILRVTEAARRHRAQRERLTQTVEENPDSSSDELRSILGDLQATLELDPENLAGNHQLYLLQIGRLQSRQKEYDAAWATLDRVLALESLDPMATDLHRAWARVYRGRIALARGDRATARHEAEAGLAMKCPALETRVAWPLAETETTAAEELLRLLDELPRLSPAKKPGR